MADALDSGSSGRKAIRVRLPSRAPKTVEIMIDFANKKIVIYNTKGAERRRRNFYQKIPVSRCPERMRAAANMRLAGDSLPEHE